METRLVRREREKIVKAQRDRSNRKNKDNSRMV